MLPADFIVIWRKWLRMPVPSTNFRNGHVQSPSYELEHDIDHSVSYVKGLVENFIAGKPLDYKKLASEELSEIEKMIKSLERFDLDDVEKKPWSDYLSDMNLIVQKLAEL